MQNIKSSLHTNKQNDVPTFKLFKGAAEWPISEIVHHEYIQQRYDSEQDRHIETHRHIDLFHILYLEKGSAEAVLDGKQFLAKAPLVVTVPTLCVHGLEPKGEVVGHLLTIPGSSIHHILGHLDEGVDFSETPQIIEYDSPESLSEIDHIIKQIASEYKHRKHSRFMALQALLRLFFVSTSRCVITKAPSLNPVHDRDADRIKRFKQLIEKQFRKSLSIKEYSNALGISAAQLNNICRAKVNKSALQIVHERVTLEAKRNLIYTSLSISEIAYNLGFNDPAYFTRFFNKQTQQSPKAFRAQARNNKHFPLE